MTIFREYPELLAGFRRGESRALEAVYRRYVEPVERIARRAVRIAEARSGLEAADDVADLVQEIFSRAFEERARLAYDGLREFGPYVATIARNLLIDWSRRHGRQLSGAELELQIGADDEAGTGPWTADPVLMQRVETFLASLPPELKRVHEQRYVLGHTQEETARVLGLSRQKVRTRELRLQRELRRQLRRAGIEP
jgi:RNA polymerase sigma-70 factor (ECF subfamily)